MKLTDISVKRKQGNGKVQKLYDGGGLFLHISAEGKKTWRLAYRYLGKQNTLTIGAYPVVSLKEAREKRDEAKRLLLENIDPNNAKKEAKEKALAAASNSFAAVTAEWLENQAANCTEKTREHKMFTIKKYLLPPLGNRPVDSIRPMELLEIFRKIEKDNKLFTAHYARQQCAMIFRYAVATGKCEYNPASELRGALKVKPPYQHYASLRDYKDIGRLIDCMESNEIGAFQVQQCLRFAPHVFVRPNELVTAQWSHIDLDAAEWRIPAEQMKMRKVHIVPLSTQALDILKTIKVYSGNCKYVFPAITESRRADYHVHVTGVRDVMRRHGFTKETMTVHGFRSMASTILNENGFNRDWIERQLAHGEQNGVRAAYNYAEYLPERKKMMQWYSDFLFKLKDDYRNSTNEVNNEKSIK